MQDDAPNMPTPSHNIRYISTITINGQRIKVYRNVRYVNTITVNGQPLQLDCRYFYFDVLPDDVIPITHYHTIYNDYTFQTGRYYYSPSLRYVLEPVYDGELYKLLPVNNGGIFYDNSFPNYCYLRDINRKYIKVYINRLEKNIGMVDE